VEPIPAAWRTVITNLKSQITNPKQIPNPNLQISNARRLELDACLGFGAWSLVLV
jgi:hypothetical protein